jgi:deoxycytidylate deaminase
MSKESRLQVFKDFTLDLATLSKCSERHVAAIITDANFTQVYSIGINGGPSGLTDCMCTTNGKYGCIHAEINALIKCPLVPGDKVMIITLSPCKQCAAAIINTPGSFKAVYYAEEWKDNTGLLLLKEAGIHVARI